MHTIVKGILVIKLKVVATYSTSERPETLRLNCSLPVRSPIRYGQRENSAELLSMAVEQLFGALPLHYLQYGISTMGPANLAFALLATVILGILGDFAWMLHLRSKMVELPLIMWSQDTDCSIATWATSSSYHRQYFSAS